MTSQKGAVRLYISLISCVFSACLSGHGFGAGTLINTPDGPVPIEQLQKDDLVISHDKISDTFVPKPIRACAKRTVSELIKLAIGNTGLLVDPAQRFYVLSERKWYAAKDLRPGQVLLQNNGKFGTISGVKKVEEETEVYDLTVQDNHNFCVSSQKVLAHNCDPLSITVSWVVVEALPEIVTAAGWVAATTVVSWGWLSGWFRAPRSNPPPPTPPATGGVPIPPDIDTSKLLINTVYSPAVNVTLPPATTTSEDIAEKTRSGGAYPDKDKQDNAKKAFACAGGAPLPPDDDPNRNPNDKSGPKIKPKTEPTREETHSIIFDTYEQARNEALKIIGLVDQKTAIPIRSDVKGICFNKIAGTRWHGHKVSMRLDHSPEDGPHINVTDFRPEKGPGGVSIKIKFKGNTNSVESLLRPLNTSANISMAKNLGVEISKIVEVATNTNFVPKTTNISNNSIGLGAATTLVTSISQNIDANKDSSRSNTAGNIINSAGGTTNTGGQIATPGFVESTLPVTLNAPSNSGINIFPILPNAFGLPTLPGTFGIPSMPSINLTPSNISPITSIAQPQLDGLTNFGLNTGPATTTNSLLQNLFNGPPRGTLGF